MKIKKTVKSKPMTRQEAFLVAHRAAIDEMCGKGVVVCNFGWFQSPDRIESKVTDRHGFDWIITSETRPNRKYHHFRNAQKGFDS